MSQRDDGTLLLTYTAHFEMGFTDVRSVYLRSTTDVHEVWRHAECGVHERLLVYRGAAWSPVVSREVIRAIVRTQSAFESVGALMQPGLIDADAWTAEIEEFAREIDAIHRTAREAIVNTPSPIVDAARELALNPQPHGSSANHWEARCPETNHPLYISTDSNEWGCGWCRRRGGADELRAFVRERRVSRSVRNASANTITQQNQS